MANKRKVPPIPTTGSNALTHSPFANLAGGNAAAEPPAAPSGSPPEPTRARSRGRLVLRRETKHRAGKAVVIIGGFDALPAFDAAAIAELARECKQALACGGTIDGTEIVLQGDRAAEVSDLLRGKGFRVEGVTS